MRRLGAAILSTLLLAPHPARAGEPLAFQELYRAGGVTGLAFSDKATALAGRQVTMRGYMAPPLKPESDFFVLTRAPMALCPFCNSDADWPADIVVVHLAHAAPVQDPQVPLSVTGRLEIGSRTDLVTGFVSQIRLVDAAYEHG